MDVNRCSLWVWVLVEGCLAFQPSCLRAPLRQFQCPQRQDELLPEPLILLFKESQQLDPHVFVFTHFLSRVLRQSSGMDYKASLKIYLTKGAERQGRVISWFFYAMQYCYLVNSHLQSPQKVRKFWDRREWTGSGCERPCHPTWLKLESSHMRLLGSGQVSFFSSSVDLPYILPTGPTGHCEYDEKKNFGSLESCVTNVVFSEPDHWDSLSWFTVPTYVLETSTNFQLSPASLRF